MDDYQICVDKEKQRLDIAEKWARINLSTAALSFERGREDRLACKPCASANGRYLDGWYSV